jgi:hypothetical protein
MGKEAPFMEKTSGSRKTGREWIPSNPGKKTPAPPTLEKQGI